MTIRWIVDPGHSWLEVPLAEYPEAKDYGSGYGYYDARLGKVYLEEDCEAPQFLHATIGLMAGRELPAVYLENWSGRDRLPRLPMGSRFIDPAEWHKTVRFSA